MVEALHLDHADPAVAFQAEVRVVAEPGNVDAELLGGERRDDELRRTALPGCCGRHLAQDRRHVAVHLGAGRQVKAADAGAHILHTSEACLSGYAGSNYSSFMNWVLL